QRADAWVFADAVPERLYFEADGKWRGELPRTYLYDAAHRATAFSGKIDPAQLERWVRSNFAAN
ncbi:MAG: TlpA family protein disulfide reductase, partial [Sulfuricella sp.]|nr:TlpA family protein disulfide reductase [Sulfuricella sp.]